MGNFAENLNLGNRVRPPLRPCLLPEEAGRAEFNVTTPTYATVAYSVR